VVVPVIVAGIGETFTTFVATQPSQLVKVIVAEPPATPVTTPVVPSIVATLPLLLLQVPQLVSVLNSSVDPAHTAVSPDISDADAFTVTKAFTWQPVATV